MKCLNNQQSQKGKAFLQVHFTLKNKKLHLSKLILLVDIATVRLLMMKIRFLLFAIVQVIQSIFIWVVWWNGSEKEVELQKIILSKESIVLRLVLLLVKFVNLYIELIDYLDKFLELISLNLNNLLFS